MSLVEREGENELAVDSAMDSKSESGTRFGSEDYEWRVWI